MVAKHTNTACPNIVWLCDTAGVSRSGYYKWLSEEETRILREEKDRADFNLILTAYKKHGYTKGARGIHMALLHRDESIVMNVKKIRRLMKKYGLTCPVRRPNPYRIALRENILEKTPPNVLDRQFRKFGPRRVLLTDITYIPMNSGKFCYLSVIKDAYTKEILSYQLSLDLKQQFVLDTFRRLILIHGKELTKETIVHSDQGVHYRAKSFDDLMEDANLIRSMSRKATCWDNAPQESFFGHMKDEIGDKVAECKTFHQISKVIIDYINYYNHYRYQWDLAKLAPAEYYEYCTTGIYPLPKGNNKNQYNG
jgi:transposase InsO family protein